MLVKLNYRLACNLKFISKIIEKVTIDQFTNLCYQYNLLPSYQSAYRKLHSCKTSLVRQANDLLWAIKNQLETSVVILDLNAEFQTVDH